MMAAATSGSLPPWACSGGSKNTTVREYITDHPRTAPTILERASLYGNGGITQPKHERRTPFVHGVVRSRTVCILFHDEAVLISWDEASSRISL